MKIRTYRFICIAIIGLCQLLCGIPITPAYTRFTLQYNKAVNILMNGDFEDGNLASWWLFVNSAEGSTAVADIKNGWCVIDDISISGEAVDWYIQLIQTFTTDQIEQLKSGATYVLTFDAYSEIDNRPCYVYLGLDSDPWTPYVSKNIFIADQPGSFRFEFTVNSVFPAIKLSFNLSHDESDVAFDNIRLEKKEPDIPARQQVIASSGMYFQTGTGSLAYTLGETVTATLVKDDKILTQGLHQVDITVIPDFVLPELNFEISAFPNPVCDHVTLKTDRFEGLHYILYSPEGNVIQQGLLDTDQTKIDFSKLKPSIYLLNVVEGNHILKTFKIIKK